MTLYHFYRLVNNVDEVCYIGMTRSELRKRLHGHRSIACKSSSKQLMDTYGRENVSIVLIHSLEFATMEEARREERRLIEENRGNCVNLYIPWREEGYRKRYMEEFAEHHKEAIRNRKKAWWEANKETEKERMMKYREARAKAKPLKSEPTVVEDQNES